MLSNRASQMPKPPRWASEARAAYLRGDEMRAIRVMAGNVSVASLYTWIDRLVAADGTVMRSPVLRRSKAGVAAKEKSMAEPELLPRQDLLNRLWAAAERQMRSIEERFASLEPGDSVGEADAKALGFVARLVKELAALDEINKGGGGDDHGGTAQAQAGIAELHAAITRQLAGLDTSEAA